MWYKLDADDLTLSFAPTSVSARYKHSCRYCRSPLSRPEQRQEEDHEKSLRAEIDIVFSCVLPIWVACATPRKQCGITPVRPQRFRNIRISTRPSQVRSVGLLTSRQMRLNSSSGPRSGRRLHPFDIPNSRSPPLRLFPPSQDAALQPQNPSLANSSPVS